MKILHIVPTYLPAHRYGGPIKSVHELNKWLVKKGADVTVYTTNIDGPNNLNVPFGQEVNMDGVKIFYFKNSFPRFWFYSGDLRFALRDNAENFDLIHITSVFLSASAIGAYYAKKFHKPYIISPRGSLMAEPLKKYFFKRLKKKIYLFLVEKRNLAGAAAIHFTSNIEKEEYVDQKFPIRRPIVIPNLFESEDFKHVHVQGYLRTRLGISNDEKIVLFLGRLSWKKGFDTLIPAFAEVLREVPQARLIIVGPDDEGYKKEIQRMIVENKLEEGKHVFFVGEIFGDEKLNVYEDHNVFVLPSYSENFGMTVIEAMHGTAHGTAAVVTEGVALGDLIKKEGAGFVVPKETHAVSEAIVKILKDPALAKKFEERGHKLVDEYFSPGKVAEKFIREYNELL